ncbi:MAG TPA: 30S ribosomal protein S20 [Vicinamibacterales bacterium]|nr:30S ribosomal protein S20 [Vicinamibacterales bacterium]
MAKKKVSSAAKAHRQSLRRRERNRHHRSRLRTALKAIRAALQNNDLETAKARLNDTFSLVDKMANKGIIHRNTAGRYKSRLVARIRAKSQAA